MAELWLRTGLNPDDPDALVLAVVVNQDGTPGERAAARLGSHGYEGDGCFTLVQTDGWAEHRLDGEVLTVDIVASPAVLEALGIGTAGFPERSAVDPDAVRLLRVSAQVVPADHERALDMTALLTAPAGTPAERLAADVRSGEHWPLILAPPP